MVTLTGVKTKILQSLRNVHSDQIARLQQKYQFEQDLLEDIRTYTKQRSAIEKDYAQAIQKLNGQFLQRRDFSVDETEDTSENDPRTPSMVWKTYLDESEKFAKKRLNVADTLQSQIAENLKTQKACNAQVFKKCQDLTQKVHEELFDTVREMSKAKKAYIELEKLAQVAREQAADAEDKFKKKNVKFFQSKATLEKNFNKSSSRMEACGQRVSVARNEYLLGLAAANAHMMRYYCKDLSEMMTLQEGDFYDQMKNCFNTLGQLEVEGGNSAMIGFQSVVTQANTICRDYCKQCFLKRNKTFTDIIKYEMEHWGKDKVNELTTEHNAGLALNKEARKLAMKLTKDQKFLKEKTKEVQGLKAMNSIIKKTEDAPTAADANQEAEQKLESLKEEIRKAETIRLKTEACLNLLRDAGVNVDEWLKSANTATDTNEQEGSQNSLNDNDNEGEKDVQHYVDDDDWDLDDTFTVGGWSDDEAEDASENSIPVPCVALYSYEGKEADELTITENEELEILQRDGAGWCKGRNKNGDTGFFPESYVEVKDTRRGSGSTQGSSYSGSYSEHQLNSHNSHSSLASSPAEATITATSALTVASGAPQETYLFKVQALYDYEATSDEELTFKEGDIIKVVRTDDNGVDDGFWEGILGSQRGVFPSLVVEEVPNSAPVVESADTPKENFVQGNFLRVKAGVDVPSESQGAQLNFVGKKKDDYIELPPNYQPGTSVCLPVDSKSSSTLESSLQPVRPAPPVPRLRCKTENASSIRKPDSTSNDRPTSRELGRPNSMYDVKTSDYVNATDLSSRSAPSTPDYVNYSEIPSTSLTVPSSKSTADYVNVSDLPSEQPVSKVSFVGSSEYKGGASSPLAIPPPSHVQGSSPRSKRSSKAGPPKPPPPTKKPTLVAKIPTSNV